MKWSKGLVPGAASGSNRPRSNRDAYAKPTEDETPWPSGPVVISTPSVLAVLRVPRRLGAPGAQRLEVFELEPVTAEVELDVLGEPSCDRPTG